jgi:hypothetical protein
METDEDQLCRRLVDMVFVADDLAAWLVGVLADAGRKRLTTVVLGSAQERELRQATLTAVQSTAAELSSPSSGPADYLAMVVSQVFVGPIPDESLAGQATLLEAISAGIVEQLAVLDDASLTGTGKSSAEVLRTSTATLAEKLTNHLVREIVLRGAQGGALAQLAAQLNHDATHLQGRRLEGILSQLTGEVRGALTRLDDTRTTVRVSVPIIELPPSVAGFTGRDEELAALAELLNPNETARTVVASAVAGLAGVGKTALAIETGYAAWARGWFEGGVLFLDLHGYDDISTQPNEALGVLLHALGIPAKHIPPNVDERAGLYRSVLAQTAAPVLLIADNASSEAQVRPLIPGIGPHKVLVTSRHILAGLGARLVDVTVLDEAAAVELLDKALRVARPDDDRISDE